eukprot:TRINITY_DN113379_c0_g1_i1.p1 TRINITY_DN113379_c0_g1~~TRINITY_DN113379_c0_g1_i1.p1  ORF type:complete len:686 (+),score=110.32 TRINITY_DN113379_c0_g1_i1:381-2438(+)
MWQFTDPHLLLHAFLPGLLFCDSLSLNSHLVRRCLKQCFLLACPGVLLGSVLTGLLVRDLFPYEWDFAHAMMFGSILAATDPVAVVSILKELGASPKLGMIIAGESMMNDGTAIVLFNFFQKVALGQQSYSTLSIFLYFVRMAVGGLLFGACAGLLALLWIAQANSRTSHTDAVVQTAIMLFTAYLTFYIGEQFLMVSGVLATVTAGIIVGNLGLAHFADREAISIIWHTIEWILNTKIFVLSGLIIGTELMDRYESFTWMDSWYLLLLYFGIHLVRGVMMLLFHPLLRSWGYGFTWQEALVVWWGGLRGAVGLALAIACDLEFRNTAVRGHPFGSRVIFHVSGIAVLTLLVNGSTCGPLCRKLGLTSISAAKDALHKDLERRLLEHSQQVFEQEKAKFGEAFGADHVARVAEGCKGVLKQEILESPSAVHRRRSTVMPEHPTHSPDRAVAVRELFLQVLRCEFLAQLDNGRLPEHSVQAHYLMESVDIAIGTPRTPLNESSRICQDHALVNFSVRLLIRIVPARYHKKLLRYLRDTSVFGEHRMICCMMVCTVQAHREAQAKLQCLCRNELSKSSLAAAQVLQESEEVVEMALGILDKLGPELIDSVAVEQVSNVVLSEQAAHISRLAHAGVLDDKHSHHLLHVIERDRERIRCQPPPSRRLSSAGEALRRSFDRRPSSDPDGI